MIKSFEGARGVAALLVALFHLKLFAAQIAPIRNGYMLVDLFFVMSGFLMCWLYREKLGHADAMLPFLVRRFGRLFPLLVFATAAFVLALNMKNLLRNLAVASGRMTGSEAGMMAYHWPTPGEAAATLSMTHGMGLFDYLILNPVSWSISVEFYAYVLFAILCLVFPARLRVLVFLLLALAGALLVAWIGIVRRNCLGEGACLDVTYDFGYVRCIASFMLGAVMVYLRAWLDRRGGNLVRVVDSSALQLALLMLLLAGMSLIDVLPALGFAFPPVFAVLILSLCRDRGALSLALATRPFQVLGERSYSIYMLHPVLLLLMEPLLRRIGGPASSLAVLVIYVLLLVWVSGLTLAWIEQPCRDWFNALPGKLRSKAGSGTVL